MISIVINYFKGTDKIFKQLIKNFELSDSFAFDSCLVEI